MKKLLLVLLMLPLLSFSNDDWGKVGHRIIGEIAMQNLTPKAKESTLHLTGGRDLALVSTWADEMRSNPDFKEYAPWHYVNLKLEEEYDGTQRSPNVVTQVTAMIKVLKDKESSFDDKSFALKYLVHMVGDIHQPMHTGRYSDYGGSKIKVEFLGRKSQKKWTNVHVLWDSDLIDDYKMSYTEYANSLLSYKTVDFEQGDIEVWTNESHQHAKKIYSELRGGELLGFDYVYENLPIVNDRLYRAGIRLANILNSIFG